MKRRPKVIWSEGVAYRQLDGEWAHWDPTTASWHLRDPKTDTCTERTDFPPPGTRFRDWGSGISPTGILVIGTGSILVAVLITVLFASNQVSPVLAAVTGVIGSFTGHAAGHAAARSDQERGARRVRHYRK